MKSVNLFYLSPNTTGGWVTFTAHLMEALESIGVKPMLYKVGNNTERKNRPFGYNREYRNVTHEDACNLVTVEPSLVVAAAKKFRDVTDDLVSLGASIVVHDPTELKNLPPIEMFQDQCVVIRKTGLDYLPKAIFIPHPYTRMAYQDHPEKTGLCVSTSRIDFDKHTEILLDANRLLPDDKQIQIRGFENRLYTKFKILPNYPEWVQSVAAYPRDMQAAFDILCDFVTMADMSVIKGDGGGSQYTFLEAWDAGTIPIIHKDWLIGGHEMCHGVNCLAVSNGKELRDMLRCFYMPQGAFAASAQIQLVHGGYKSLAIHNPTRIGSLYAEFLDL